MSMSAYVEKKFDGQFRYFSTAVPTALTDGTFQVGDEVVNTVPTAGGTYKWICVTATVPSTSTPAVFKAVAIAA